MLCQTITDVGSAEGLAYDEFFQEIYWTSYTNSSISRISVNRHRFVPERKKIIQLGPDDHPRAIVIDSCESLVTAHSLPLSFHVFLCFSLCVCLSLCVSRSLTLLKRYV